MFQKLAFCQKSRISKIQVLEILIFKEDWFSTAASDLTATQVELLPLLDSSPSGVHNSVPCAGSEAIN